MCSSCVSEAVTWDQSIFANRLSHRRFCNSAIEIALCNTQSEQTSQVLGGVDGRYEHIVHGKWFTGKRALCIDKIAAVVAIATVT